MFGQDRICDDVPLVFRQDGQRIRKRLPAFAQTFLQKRSIGLHGLVAWPIRKTSGNPFFGQLVGAGPEQYRCGRSPALFGAGRGYVGTDIFGEGRLRVAHSLGDLTGEEMSLAQLRIGLDRGLNFLPGRPELSRVV
ncbi:hypothetical protein [Bradyrhizobium sp.]|uniref:hypothetical protein n=1 Tax=Bradyrhizobium sp. TaxID=376 RepID=UPI003C1A40EC